MDSETNGDALRSTLEDLAYLLINPSRLTILNDSEVGSGGYGEVCLATLDGSLKVAVKQLRIIQARGTKARVAMRLARELKIWAKAQHPNVLRLIGYYLSENYGCAQLVSPYMEYGNINEYLKRTQPGTETRLGFVRGITLGVAYLHSCDPPICHGDLKPANVLINEKPDAVLCDFGLATFVENSGDSSGLTTSRSIKGSLRYMSPELFDDNEAKHTLKSDIWAWACTIFEIIANITPYAKFRSDGSVMVAVVRGVTPGSIELLGSLIPEVDVLFRSTLGALQALIPKCWNNDPVKRPSAFTVVKHLEYGDLGFPAPPASPSPPPTPVVENELEVDRYQAIYGFVGQGEGEMSLEKNDVVELIEKDANGWWFVKKGLDEGWVPFNHLKLIPPKL